MGQPASGSRFLFALAREAEQGIPGSEPFLFHRAVLPAAFDLTRSESPSGEVNQSGFAEAALAGAITGPLDFALRMAASSSLEILENLLPAVTKSEPEPGIFRYDFAPDNSTEGTSFQGLYAIPPVETGRLLGLKISSLTHAIADNAMIPSRLAIQAQHASLLSVPIADAGNTGSYPGPKIRGPMTDPAAGDIHVTCTRTVAGGGLQFKVEVTAAVPTFPGAAVDVYKVEGRGAWQNLQDEAGLDIGTWDENRDPCEIVWPSTDAEHGTIALGDTWVFEAPGAWPAPVPTYLSGQRFTSAHLLTEWAELGSSSWSPIKGQGGSIVLANPVSEDRGNGSRYPQSLDRDGLLAPVITLPRRHRDTLLQDKLRRHQRFQLRSSVIGQQLSAGLRESIVYTFPSVGVAAAPRPVSNPQAIVETGTLNAEASDAGDPPVTATVLAGRDWTPAA